MISVIRNGMRAALQGLDATTNNIANASTTAFKRRDANFADIYSTSIDTASRSRLGLGVSDIKTRMSQTQGGFKETGVVLDLAIEGNGLFALQDGANQLKNVFTRDGSFTLNGEGVLVNRDGYTLLSSTGQEIKIPPRASGYFTPEGFKAFEEAPLTNVTIGAGGSVEVTYGTNNVFSVGRIGLAIFSDPNHLTPIGSNLFKANNVVGEGEIGAALVGGRGKVHAGKLEMANVDITQEMTGMIRAQQAFSGSSRLLQAEVEMMRKFT